MTTRYDVTSPRKRGDKTYWARIGSAWPAKDGDGFNVELDALPLPDAEGRCSFIIRQAKDLREASGTGSRQTNTRQQSAPIDDEVPF